MKQTKTLSLVQLALLTALILLLAFVPNLGYIRIPGLFIQATTIHIPVIVGSILLGPKKGAFLGFVFGLTSLINNTTQPGLTSFCFSPFIEIGEGLGGSPLALIICFVPRILCGVVPHFVYRGIQKLRKNRKQGRSISLLVAGAAGSMTNTILVMSMIYLFFGHAYAVAKNMAYEAVLGAVLSTVFINGTIEAIVAAIIAAAAVAAVVKAKLIKLD